MYIEITPTINFFQNVADTKWISGTYRTFIDSVKLDARKIRL
jgi:hypothetical protein